MANIPVTATEMKFSLTADLQRGTYELWCPVGQHRQLGMETTFTIQ